MGDAAKAKAIAGTAPARLFCLLFFFFFTDFLKFLKFNLKFNNFFALDILLNKFSKTEHSMSFVFVF